MNVTNSTPVDVVMGNVPLTFFETYSPIIWNLATLFITSGIVWIVFVFSKIAFTWGWKVVYLNSIDIFTDFRDASMVPKTLTMIVTGSVIFVILNYLVIKFNITTFQLLELSTIVSFFGAFIFQVGINDRNKSTKIKAIFEVDSKYQVHTPTGICCIGKVFTCSTGCVTFHNAFISDFHTNTTLQQNVTYTLPYEILLKSGVTTINPSKYKHKQLNTQTLL